MTVQTTLDRLKTYFEDMYQAHGSDPIGVGWNSHEAQTIRFEQLLKLVQDPSESFTIIDYGCGYGALAQYLMERNYTFTYAGYDMSPSSVQAAQELYKDVPSCTFTDDPADLQPADYVVGSGLFGIRLDSTQEEWDAHVLETISILWSLSKKGMAFNSLTSYSDPEKMRPELYYPDPCILFDHCKRNFSRWVSLLHDYGLYDFTILVRQDTH